LTQKMKATWSFQNSDTISPITYLHTPEGCVFSNTTGRNSDLSDRFVFIQRSVSTIRTSDLNCGVSNVVRRIVRILLLFPSATSKTNYDGVT
jgi:hypothetical protein